MENRTARWICSHIGRRLARWILSPFVKTHIIPPPTPIPKGPLLLAANHVSHFDPPILGAFSPRQIDWMAMEELFRNPMAGRALRALGAFPVVRGTADRAAIRTALARLKAGALVGIFPEGGIRAGEVSILGGAPMRPGVAVLAMMADVPVVPCVILGSERLYLKENWRLFRRIPVWIAFGSALRINPDLSGSEARDDFVKRLQETMVAMQSELVRRFDLRDEDMPRTPQARKGEDPYVSHGRRSISERTA